MSRSTANFEATLKAAQTGDDWAVEHLYVQLHPSVLRYLRWEEPSVADDLASETWLAVAEGLARFEGDQRAFRGWIFTIARRRLSDHRRKEGRRRTRPVPNEMFADAATAEDPSELALDRISAQTAIARLGSLLPPEQAEVVVLRVVGGLNVDEVAGILGKRPGAIRALQHRALRRLAIQLNDTFPLEV